MPVYMRDIVAHLNTALGCAAFRDYGPNGLQVEGAPDVEVVITGVSANGALFERAIEQKAQLVVVHHGLIWGAGLACVDGLVARRLRQLLAHNISLAAYHLPLDAHAELGNNAGLRDALELRGDVSSFGDVRGHALGMAVTLRPPLAHDALVARVAAIRSDATPPFVFAHGPNQITRVGLCTGAASDLLEAAAAAGCQAFITGELAERAQEVARELRITLIAAGHHATEVFGPARLAAEIGRAFPGVRSSFVNVPGAL